MQVKGSFVNIDGVEYYKISNSEKLTPFFIQIASSSDIWVFLSSNGGLTAGRQNALCNIFPYTTDDKLNLDFETGSKTIVKINDKTWQPFEQYGTQKYNITRNIYKSCYANSVILEEINNDLSLSYSYKYEPSEKYGIVKTSKFENLSNTDVKLQIVDGLMNIMPYGVNPILQAESSTLADAYKAAELQGDNLAIFSLTTTINDTPHPIEMLYANIAYNTMPLAKVYLNPDILTSFINDGQTEINPECYGKKCGYFINFESELKAQTPLSYSFVLDVKCDHSKIMDLLDFINSNNFNLIKEDIENGTNALVKIVKDADGIQNTADKIACSAHYLNTLYNVMRGGAFEKGYEFEYDLFYKFISKRNKEALENKELLSEIKKCKTVHELKETAKKDALVYRLALEYMPLSFSRRHGDPSRPWNKFNIALKDENGEKSVNYEGNWRDIFQNWEALGLSYPMYYENMVAKFVNASTIDGFNPYRINNDGIDWEKPEPENPFGGLGYWGDHQIIYLLRLLLGLNSHCPECLDNMMLQEIFSYANVPYIIKEYSDIVKDSKNTIVFDFEKDENIDEKVLNYGTDAKLILKNDKVYTVSLAEKLLVPLLSKISNLLPGGGVWMNTQRPEWNDANNAIVGIGLSVITVYHLKAYLGFLKTAFENKNRNYNISKEVANWLVEITDVLAGANGYEGNEKFVLDKMGEAFSNYRKKVYNDNFSEKITLSEKDIVQFIDEAIKLVDYTILLNKKDVFVSYNLLKDDFTFEPMKPMLEGQSAAIAGGFLNAEEVCNLIDAMKKDLYDEDEKYHTLYPVNKTTRFFDKNNIDKKFDEIPNIIEKDKNGNLHFNAQIASEEILLKKCTDAKLSSDKTKEIIAEFENVFTHKKFNGRSDRMYKFEGIGCVYWHQNAKFALGVLETAQKSFDETKDIEKIYKAYNDILQGFIYRKTPLQCKAIPIEPYSHTSFNKKSEQPGMTGQVKESVIMRRGELGVKVKDASIVFESAFLHSDEFNEADEIEFYVCGVPCKYKKSGEKGIKVFTDSDVLSFAEYAISKDISREIFMRSEKVKFVEILI